MSDDVILLTLVVALIACASALLLEPIYSKYKAKYNKRKWHLKSLREELEDAEKGMVNSLNNPNSLIYYDSIRQAAKKRISELNSKRIF